MLAVVPVMFRGCGQRASSVILLHSQQASSHCSLAVALPQHHSYRLPPIPSVSVRSSVEGFSVSIQTNYRPVKPVFKRAFEFLDRVAIRDVHGEYTYASLLEAAVKLSAEVTQRVRGNLQERVVIVCPNDASHVVAQWACWISGQIAVPVSPRHPVHMLEYFATDCDSNLILTASEYEAVIKDVAVKVGCKVHVISDVNRKEAIKPVNLCADNETKVPNREGELEDKVPKSQGKLKLSEDLGRDPAFYSESDALIIYTSGNSGSPKGVVMSFSNLEARVRALVESWEWRSQDCILHAMPLDHSQGLINTLLCPLSVGARCVMMKEFDSADVWAELMGVKKSVVDRVNVLMGTPPMYARLVEQYDSSLTKSQRMIDYIRSSCVQKIRLMTCCSSPVPRSVFDRWQQITGHQLLESYSVTETGVVFSNPLHGVRTQGTVGLPLPGVYVRLVDESDGSVLAEGSNIGTTIMSQYRRTSTNPADVKKTLAKKSMKGVFNSGGNAGRTTGLLEVRGDSVFRQYWRKPNATTREFTHDGWLKTGDIAQYKGAYSVLGQYETDIVTTGGFKVSALQVETTLLDLEGVKEATVVGLPDSTWGHKLGALVAAKDGVLTEDRIRTWAKDKLPEYAVPSVVRIVRAIPRNAVSGKVNKLEIAAVFFGQEKQEQSKTKTGTK